MKCLTVTKLTFLELQSPGPWLKLSQPQRTHTHGNSDKHPQLTRHVDLYQSRACADAIGGVADVRSSKLVGHRAFEEQGVVLDFNIVGKRSIQPEKNR